MLTQGQVIDFIQKSFGNIKLSNGGLNVSVICPVCSEKEKQADKKKLVIRTDNWLCHCWKCGYKSKNLYQLIRKYKYDFLSEYEEISGIKPLLTVTEYEQQKNELDPIKLPTDFTLLALYHEDKTCSSYIKEALRYIRGRGLGLRDLWYWKFGISEEPSLKNRIIIPSFDKNGNLNYFTARSFNKYIKGSKYFNAFIEREKLIFNELNIDWNQELTLVEGVFDATKTNDNVGCLLGSELGINYLLFQKIIEYKTPVLFALDNDAKHKTLKYAKLFSSYGIQVRIVEIPSSKNDVGELTKEEFNLICKDAKLFELQDFIKLKLDLLERI